MAHELSFSLLLEKESQGMQGATQSCRGSVQRLVGLHTFQVPEPIEYVLINKQYITCYTCGSDYLHFRSFYPLIQG